MPVGGAATCVTAAVRSMPAEWARGLVSGCGAAHQTTYSKYHSVATKPPLKVTGQFRAHGGAAKRPAQRFVLGVRPQSGKIY